MRFIKEKDGKYRNIVTQNLGSESEITGSREKMDAWTEKLTRSIITARGTLFKHVTRERKVVPW